MSRADRLTRPSHVATDGSTITMSAAARELGVTRGTVRMHVLRGRLRAVEAFGRVLIARADLETFRREHPKYVRQARGGGGAP